MVERICRHKESIKQYTLTRKPLHPPLTNQEWDKLTNMVGLLRPCKDATELLGGEKYVSASIVVPQLAHLLHVYKHDDDDPAYVTRFKTALITDLKVCWRGVEFMFVAELKL